MFGDRVYLFGSHDTPGGESFCLEDYEFFSAPLHDLSHWTSRGANYSAKQDPLYGENARYLYAPDVVQGNDGRYYLYYCLAGWKGESGYFHPISVAVCDSPDGKYEYYGVVQNLDGTPYQGFVCFDPAVINDGGVIRLYFGTGPFRGMAVKPWNAFVLSRVYSGVFGKPTKAFLQKPGPLGANAAVLCDDMLTLKAPPKRIADTPDFKGHAFFEGSSIRKIGDRYYFIYSSQKNHELCYATSSYPDREFRYGRLWLCQEHQQGAGDLYVMLALCLLSLFMSVAGLPTSPLVLAFILSSKLERYFRQGISYAHGSYAPFFTRPISLILLLVSEFCVFWPYISDHLKAKKAGKAETIPAVEANDD